MPDLARRCAALVLVLSIPLVVPAVGAAQEPDAEFFGCTSAELLLEHGRCDARRPTPEIVTEPRFPRADARIVLTADSGGRGLAYAWDLDDDGAHDDATGARAEVTLPAGNHRVRVRVTDEDGRVGATMRTLVIHAHNLAPEGTLTVSPPQPRVGQEVTVSASGRDVDGTVRVLELDLDGDGAYEVRSGEASAERTVTFDTAGRRTLRLRVTDDAGATWTTTRTVDVHAANVPPVAAVQIDPPAPRPGQLVTVSAYGTDSDGSAVRYAFDLDGDGAYEADGSTAYVRTVFDTAGERVVGVRVTDDQGAQGTARRSVSVKAVNEPPVVTIHSGDSARVLTASASDPDGEIAQYAWDLDDDGAFDDRVGPHLSVGVLPDDVYGVLRAAVRVTDNDGGVTIRTHAVTLLDRAPLPPTLSWEPGAVRAGQTFTLVAGTPTADIVSFEWDLDGDGRFDPPTPARAVPVSLPAGAHTVAVRVTDARGRTAIARQNVDVAPATGHLPPAVAIDGDASARVGGTSTYRFSGRGSIAWDLDGDGAFDDGREAVATRTFSAVGAARIGLRVKDDSGAVATAYRDVEVHAENRAPEFELGATLRVARDVAVQLVGTPSGTNDDALTSWAWDTDDDGAFDDGDGVRATVRFGVAGTTRVRLRATDAGGRSSVATLPVIVGAATANRAPVVTLDVPPGAARPGTPVSLSAQAVDPDGEAPAYAWDADGDGAFDDGSGPQLEHVYARPGVFDVRVRVTDGRGGQHVVLRSLTVVADNAIAPVFINLAFSQRVRVDRPALLYASAVTGTGSGSAALSFDLDGDGEFDDTPSSASGGYRWTFTDPVTVAVKATDVESGATAIRTFDVRPVAANLAPVAVIRSGRLVGGKPVSLQADAQDPDGEGLEYAWDLDGDGAFDDDATALAPLPDLPRGTYTVGLRVTDADGATVTTSRTITISTEPPMADFDVSNVQPDPGERVTLTSTAHDPDDALTSTAWDLDDDGAFDDATGTIATVSFPTPGGRLVGLKVRDAAGDTAIKFVRLLVGGELDPPATTPTPTPSLPVATATPMATATPAATTTPAATATATPAGPVATATASLAATATPATATPATATPTTAATTSPPPAAAPVASAITAEPRAVTLAGLVKSGLPVRVRCAKACAATIVASVDATTAKRLGIARELGRATRTVADEATVTVKLSARARSALREEDAVSLRLQVSVDGKVAARRTVTARR